MNTPPSPQTSPGVELTGELLPVAPTRSQSLFKLIVSIGAVITALLTGLSMAEEMLPPEYAVYAICATGFLGGLVKMIEAIGDMLDNGQMDGSFTLGKKPVNPAVIKQWTGLILIGCLLGGGLVSCSTTGMSQKQMSYASAGYAIAEIGLAVAEATLQEKLADPKTPAWQVLSAKLAFSQAKKAVDKEQAKLDAAFAAMLAGDVPPSLAMPAYTGGKVSVLVMP